MNTPLQEPEKPDRRSFEETMPFFLTMEDVHQIHVALGRMPPEIREPLFAKLARQIPDAQ